MIKLIKSTFYKEKKVKRELLGFIRLSRQLSFGPQCIRFERNFARYQGRKFCIFVNSGSSANLSLIQSLLNLDKLKRGDYVGVSSISWATNIMPLIQFGLVPVPIDVEFDTLNVSSDKLEKVLSKFSLKALFLTNALGLCHDIDKIREICNSQGIILLEDNCESLGSVYKKTKLGNFGFASTFSFYVAHQISTIEGGAICTDDEELARMLKIVRAHGWDRNLDSKNQSMIRKSHKILPFYSKYTFYDLAYNIRPTEINGFIGNIQLKYIDEIVKKRFEIFKKFANILYKPNNPFLPIQYKHLDVLSSFAIPVICKNLKIRDKIVSRCRDNLEIRPIIGGNITKQPFFKKYIPRSLRYLKLSNADFIHRNGLYFGNNPELNRKEINIIISIFNYEKTET